MSSRPFLFALCLALPSSVVADTLGPRVSAFRAGIACGQEVLATAPATDTVAGVTNIIEGEVEFISNGRMVPAVLGISFGAKVQAKGDPITDVMMQVTHPPMGAEGTTRESYFTNISATDMSLALFQFDYDYELVEGPWTITALKDGETIYSVDFTVVSPAAVPGLAAVCGYEDLLG